MVFGAAILTGVYRESFKERHIPERVAQRANLMSPQPVSSCTHEDPNTTRAI